VNRAARPVVRRVVRAVLVAGTALAVPVLTPSPAAACDVGVGYRPEISFGRGGLAGGTCSTATSLTGALLLFLLALAVLAALAAVAYRRGEAAAAALAGGDQTGAGQVGGGQASAGQAGAADATLTRYLDSVGISRGRSGGGPAA
jgi:hypothetical protein